MGVFLKSSSNCIEEQSNQLKALSQLENQILIRGQSKLTGEIIISGSKNASLPIIAATILTNKKVVLYNVPALSDIYYMLELIKAYGKKYTFQNNILTITKGVFKPIADVSEATLHNEIFKKIRASCLILGPGLAMRQRIKVKMPGGCAIGARPIDLHLRALQQMGAEISLEKNFIIAEAPCRLEGKEITFKKSSVGATQNIIMAAVLAKGTTRINNAALEPEVTELINFLKQIGSNIEGGGTRELIIHGTDELNGGSYKIIPDRIEASTYLIAAAAIGGKITLKNTDQTHIASVLAYLKATNAVKIAIHHDSNNNDDVDNNDYDNQGNDIITVEKINYVSPIDIITESYPGFPTDLQPQFMSLMCLARGSSIIRENIFENRFQHVPELQKLGCNIKFIDSQTVKIEGQRKIFGSFLRIPDLRAGAALVIAALASYGKSVITDCHYIHRGYEDLAKKLRNCNANIIGSRIKSSPTVIEKKKNNNINDNDNFIAKAEAEFLELRSNGYKALTL